ncbi:hypothetical protein [Azospirillum canadense]|uniref:hypothetical protein n=1 Tax=Azospirillum canadense TaxID=403962 RepID=UPI0022265E54|nr:hypothetical protein [Azospirillum canadense]MCW2240671.1 hypothetical protein [Azospirillum canadense]
MLTTLATTAAVTLAPAARFPLLCPVCNATAAALFTGRRLSESAAHPLSTDTVWIPSPFPLDGAPLPPAGFPSGARHETTAHFGACPACQAPLLTLSLSIASTPTPLVHGQFVHDDLFLGIAPRGNSSRTLAARPSLFAVHTTAHAAPHAWAMLREHYVPLPAGQPVTPIPSLASNHALAVDQHILAPVSITADALAILRGPGGLAIQHCSLQFWGPLLATLHAVAPLVAPLADRDADTHGVGLTPAAHAA